MKKLKSILALVIAIILVSNCLPVFASIQSGADENGIRNWMYEGFDDAEGWENASYAQYGVGALGEVSTNGTGYPQGWRYHSVYNVNAGAAAADGTNYKFTWAGTEDDGFFGFNYATSKYMLGNSVYANRTKNTDTIDADFEARALNERIDIGTDWVDFEGKLIISYDVLLPSLTEIENGATLNLLPRLMQEAKLNGSYKTYSAANLVTISAKKVNGSPQITIMGIYTKNGAVINDNPLAPGSAGGGALLDITAKAGKWITVQSVIERVNFTGIENDKYCVTSYVDGKLIDNGSFKAVAWYNPDSYAYEGLYKSSYDKNNQIEYIAPYIQFAGAQSVNFWGGIDNIKMCHYGDTALDSLIKVDEATDVVEIKTVNTAISSDAPDAVKSGVLVNPADISVNATKYPAGDVFETSGEAVDVTLKTVSPQKKYVSDSVDGYNAEYSSDVNGESIFVEIPNVAEGEKIVLEFEGLEDLFGNAVLNDTVVIHNIEGVLGVNAENIFGDAVEFGYDEENDISVAPIDMMKLVVKYPAGSMLVLTDGEETVASASNNTGIEYEFNLSEFLKPGTVYYVNNNEGTILSFITGEGQLSYSAFEKVNGIYTAEYINTTDEEYSSVIVAVSYDGNKASDIVCTEVVFEASTSGEVAAERALSGGSDGEDVFVIDGFRLGEGIPNSSALSCRVSEDARIATVSGRIEDEEELVAIVYTKDDIPVFAKRITPSAKGEYSFEVDLSDSEEPADSHKAYVYAGEKVFYAVEKTETVVPEMTSRNWFFDDFNNSSNWQNGSEANYSSKYLGDVQTKGTGYPFGWRYHATGFANSGNNAGDGDKYKFVWAGTEEDGFFGFNYAEKKYAIGNSVSANRIIGSSVNASAESRVREERMYLDCNDWIDYDGTFVLSYDLYLPTVEEIENGASVNYETYLMHEYEKTTVSATALGSNILGRLPVISAKVADGVPQITAAGYYTNTGKRIERNPTVPQDAGGATIGGTIYMDITDKAGQWITVQNVVERTDDLGLEDDKYSISSYIDGKLISDGTTTAVAYYNPGHRLSTETNVYSYEENYRYPVDGTTISYIAPYIQFRQFLGTNFWGGVDNVRMTEYGKTYLAESVQATAGQHFVKVPVFNTAVTDENAPDGARIGIIGQLSDDVSCVKATKYGADDPMMNGGEEITVTIAAENPETKSLTAPLEYYSAEMKKSVNGEYIYVNIPELASGERLVLEFEGLEDIMGNPIEGNKVIVYNENSLVKLEAKNFFGEALETVYDEENGINVIPSDVKTITVGYTGGDNLLVSDGTTTVASAAAVGDEYEFSFNKTLLPETVYYIRKFSGEDVASFKTGKAVTSFGGFVKRADGRLIIDYVNSYTSAQDAAIIAISYDGIKKHDIVHNEKTLSARTFGTVMSDSALVGGENADAFIVAKSSFESAVESSEKVYFAPFSNDRKSKISGKIGENENAFAVITNSEGEAVYAKRITGDNNGAFAFDVDFSGYESSDYTVYICSESGVFRASRASAVPGENKDALSTLKSKTSATAVYSYISDADNAVLLEFDYELFDLLDADGKKKAADYLYTALSDIDADDKAASVKIFKNAVIMAALTENEAEDIEKFIDDLSVLENEKVAKWFDYRSEIPETRTEKWREGVVSRLSGKSFSDFEDFADCFVEALVYEVVANHGIASVLVECVSDLNNEFIRAGKDGHGVSYVDEVYISRLSSDGKKYSQLDGYETLKNDLKKYESSIYYTGGGSGGSGGSGGGGGSSIPTAGLPNVSAEPVKPVGEKGMFGDMDGYAWATEVVTALAKEGIVSGKSEGIFAPGDSVLREEFTKMVVEAAGVTDEGEISFKDVDSSDWFCGYIKKAYKAGIINGISAELFGAGQKITRQDMAVIIWNVLKTKDVEVESASLSFEDAEEISDYAKEAVSVLAALGIINGYEDGTFKPMGNANRAEAAKVIYGILKYLD